MNDFPKSTLRKLAKKGITLVGITAIPDMRSPMPWANAERGYVLNDNGTQIIRNFMQVAGLA